VPAQRGRILWKIRTTLRKGLHEQAFGGAGHLLHALMLAVAPAAGGHRRIAAGEEAQAHCVAGKAQQ